MTTRGKTQKLNEYHESG